MRRAVAAFRGMVVEAIGGAAIAAAEVNRRARVGGRVVRGCRFAIYLGFSDSVTITIEVSSRSGTM